MTFGEDHSGFFKEGREGKGGKRWVRIWYFSCHCGILLPFCDDLGILRSMVLQVTRIIH